MCSFMRCDQLRVDNEEGRRLLAEADLPGLHVETTMLGGAERVVELAKTGATVEA